MSKNKKKSNQAQLNKIEEGKMTEKEKSQLEKLLVRKKVTPDELKVLISEIRTPSRSGKGHSYHFKTKKSTHRYGVLGDMHFGSKFHDGQALQIYMDKANDFGVDFMLDPGDSVDGTHNMHRGMWREQSHLGFKNQLDAYEEGFPNIGVQTYRINGNHDLSFVNTDGADVGEIARRREDITHLGDEQADFMVGKTKIRLLHPGGGGAYALSYKPQKIIEAYGGDEKPHILHINHFHKMMHMFYRNVHAFQDGTFQSQSAFMKRMGLAAHKGSWLIKFENIDDGTVVDLDAKFVPFYK